MPQIALVTHKHDDNIAVSMIPQLLQPPRHILICLMLRDIIDKQRSHSAAVVGRRDSSVTLLASCIPDLCLDSLGVNLNAASGELHADGGLAIEVEFVAGESRE